MNRETELYITRIIRVFEKYPQIAEKSTKAIEDVGVITQDGWGEVIIQIKEHLIHKRYCTFTKKD